MWATRQLTIVPLRMLLLAKSKTKLVRRPSSEGSDPESWLECTIKVRTDGSAPTSEGIVPVKLLLDKVTVCRPSSNPNEEGIFPDSFVLAILSNSSASLSPISELIVPERKLLFARDKDSKEVHRKSSVAKEI